MVENTAPIAAEQMANKPKAAGEKPGEGTRPEDAFEPKEGHETPDDRAAQNAEVAKATNEIAGGT